MSLSDEMKSLYQNLRAGLGSESATEKELITKTLDNETIQSNLEFRLRIVQLVGLIKFFNNLPIYVPAVEQKILESIETDSIAKHLNPVLTTSFFKIVMEHSKAVQTRLGELLKGKEEEAKKMLSDCVSSLKHDRPDKADIFTSLGDEKVPASQNLGYCRGLIQAASDNVLNEMAAISAKAKINRRISVVMNGLFAMERVKLAPGTLAQSSKSDTPANGMRADAVCRP